MGAAGQARPSSCTAFSARSAGLNAQPPRTTRTPDASFCGLPSTPHTRSNAALRETSGTATNRTIGSSGKGIFRCSRDWNSNAVRSAIRARRVEGTVLKLMSNVYVFWGFWGVLDRRSIRMGELAAQGTIRRASETRQDGYSASPTAPTQDGSSPWYSAASMWLRNQLMHGCATREGTLNRRQVNDGAELLEILVPLFVDIMADHPGRRLG